MTRLLLQLLSALGSLVPHKWAEQDKKYIVNEIPF